MAKIGLFYRDYNSAGGMPLEYKCLVDQLSLLQHEIIIYCYGEIDKTEIQNTSVIIKQFKKKKHNLIAIPKSFKLDLCKINFNCFFLVSAHLPENISVSRELIRNKLKYVYCVGSAYNPYLLKRKFFLAKIYRKFFELKILNNADIIRTYSETNTSFIKNYGGQGEFFELLEGINNDDIPIEINKHKFKNDKINLVYLGRIDYYGKGLDQLMLSFYKVVKGNLNFKLHIYGPYASKKDKILLENHLKKFSKNNIEYYGPIYGINKFEILKGADLFIYPSRFEGIPRSIREALFFGTPVIVTKETNFAEYVETYKAGFICECESNSIFESILAYKNYPNKHELYMNAKYLTKQFYNWNSVRERLKILLERYTK